MKTIVERRTYTLATHYRVDPLMHVEDDDPEPPLTRMENTLMGAYMGVGFALFYLGVLTLWHYRHEIWAWVRGLL